MATQSNRPTLSYGSNSRAGADLGGRYFGDFYHHLMTASWPYLLFLIAAAFAVTNCLFAFAYMLDGGVENARPGSFADVFFFSVQTMATIGYGKMAPATLIANILMSVEALSGLVSLALVTGLIVGVYIGVVLLTTDVFRFSSSVGVAASTPAILCSGVMSLGPGPACEVARAAGAWCKSSATGRGHPARTRRPIQRCGASLR